MTPLPPHPIRRVAMLSVHTCPLALLGGKKTGGMNVYVRDLSRELGRRGIQVDVFTRSEDACQPRIRHDLGFGGRVIHVPAGPEHPVPVAEIGAYLDEFVAGVLAYAQEEGAVYDLIHSHYWLSGLVAERLRALWGVPFVQMFHTLGHMKNAIASDERHRAGPERLAGEARVIEAADRLVAATEAERQQLIQLYGADPARITIIPPGVDLERFHPIPEREAKGRVGIACGDTNILFAGRIEPLKGIDTLLRAFALIKGRFPWLVHNTCVAIIGGDPWDPDPDTEMARLQSMRAELDLEDLVLFLGAKDQDLLPNYYAAAAMVVMPSHYESFGMVALEAMAMGTPVIASEVGGLAHLVRDGETGFHVPSRDPEALAARIVDLLAHEECRLLLGQQARAHAQQFSWTRIASQIVALYQAQLRQPVAGPECLLETV